MGQWHTCKYGTMTHVGQWHIHVCKHGAGHGGGRLVDVGWFKSQHLFILKLLSYVIHVQSLLVNVSTVGDALVCAPVFCLWVQLLC